MDTLVSKRPPSGPGTHKPAKDKASHKTLISRHLKLVYDDIAREKLPQQMQDLLSQMDEKTEVKS